jgi:hypothetical protein
MFRQKSLDVKGEIAKNKIATDILIAQINKAQTTEEVDALVALTGQRKASGELSKGQADKLKSEATLKLDLLEKDAARVTLDVEGKSLDLTPSKAADVLLKQRELDEDLTDEQKDTQRNELTDSIKRINTTLGLYGQSGGIVLRADGSIDALASLAGQQNGFIELSKQAAAGNPQAILDKKSVARDMYNIRAPNNLIQKEDFSPEINQLLEAGEVQTLKDENGVILRLQKDPSGLIRIVEVVG